MEIKLLSKDEKDKELKTIKTSITVSIINSIISVAVFIYFAMISSTASNTTIYIILALTIGTTLITGINLNNSLKLKELTLDAYSLSLISTHLNLDITNIKTFGTEHKRKITHMKIITIKYKYDVKIKEDTVISCVKKEV